MKYKVLLLLFLMPSYVLAEDIRLCKDGWHHTESGEHNQAIKLLKECIEVGELSNPSLARTYRNIGIASYRSHLFTQAIKNYDKALSLNPVDLWHDYVNRGNAWSELGEYAKALSDYSSALSVKPNFNKVFYNRGIIFEKQGELGKAVEEFKQAYEYGLRTSLLYERFVVYGLIENE